MNERIMLHCMILYTFVGRVWSRDGGVKSRGCGV